MDRREILAKSRTENKNRDIYELEVLNQAGKIAVIATSILAGIFYLTQVSVGSGMNWGMMALIWSGSMTIFWVKFIKLRRKHELVMAIFETILVSAMSGYHIYQLIASSAIS